jgi:hypothetical protein
MNARHTKRLIPRLDTMEQRLPLSHTVPTLHAMPAAHLLKAPKNPVLLNLDPQATGIQITSATYYKRFGVIGIGGVVTFPAINPPSDPSGQPTTSIGLEVSQGANPRHNTYGSAYSARMSYVSTGFTTTFTLYATAYSKRFQPGTATVTIRTDTYWPSHSYDWPGSVDPSASAIVRLTPVKIKPA